MSLSGFQKREISLRYWLQGRGYFDALKTMNLVDGLYAGKLRKDGTTPEFDHPISIAHFVRTLPDLLHPQESISAALGHDLGEPPYNLSRSEYEPIAKPLAARAIECMTKKHRDEVFDEATVFDWIARDPIASVVKPADRIHNLQTMVGVFSPEKQQRYVNDVRRLFLPAIKISRRLFPEQELAYENLKHVLVSQCELIEAALDAGQPKAA